MSDVSEDPTELHDLIYRALERNGVISNIRAQLRSSVYTVIDSESKKISDPNNGLSFAQELLTNSKTNQIALTIVRDFLIKLKLFYTVSLLDRELSLDQVDVLPQDIVNDDPLLGFLNTENQKMEKDKQSVPILSILIDEHKKVKKRDKKNNSSIGDSGINDRTSSKNRENNRRFNNTDLLPNNYNNMISETKQSNYIAANRITPLGEVSKSDNKSLTYLYNDENMRSKSTLNIKHNVKSPKDTSLLKQTVNLHKKQNLYSFLNTIPSIEKNLSENVKRAYVENIYSESKHLEELRENLLDSIFTNCRQVAKDSLGTIGH